MRSSSQTETTQRYPLSGIKVLELATFVAAPTAARMLCAYGAEVIKVETLTGDSLRFAGMYEDAPVDAFNNPLFTVQNSNKKLVALNLKTEDGLAVFLKLLADADVFITNVRGKALERLGLDYESLRDRFPRLIYAHFTSYGTEGKEADSPGFDMTAFWARSGAMCDWPGESRPPFAPTYAFGDISASGVFLSGILMALIARSNSGKGGYFTTSLFASGIWHNADGLVTSQFRKRPFGRNLLRPTSMFATVYQCKDGKWISIYAGAYNTGLKQFARIMDMEDLLEDARCQDFDSLHHSGVLPEVMRRCQARFLERTASEWREYLQANDMACEIATPTRDLCHDEQAIANGYVEPVDYRAGSVTMAAPPLSFSDYSHRDYVPCGSIGQDTDEVLLSLGYSAEEIAALKEEGAAL